jgi:hypothetical protein
MSFVIIDTNVLMVANEDYPPGQVDMDDIKACIERLEAIQTGRSKECVVLDTEDWLLGEYQKTLQSSQQPSTGHAFLHWLFQSGWNPTLCDRVQITCKNESEQVFAEFPTHVALSDFDVADRKFVATSNAHKAKPPILQAVDSKWKSWEPALNECGIKIEWLCPETAKRLYAAHLAGM